MNFYPHYISWEALLTLRPEPKATTSSHLYRPPVLDNIPEEFVRKRRKKQGRRGGTRNRLRRGFTHPPLLYIVLSNLRSLNNKIGMIRTIRRHCNKFHEALLLCFVESHLNPSKPDSLYENSWFHSGETWQDQNDWRRTLCLYEQSKVSVILNKT